MQKVAKELLAAIQSGLVKYPNDNWNQKFDLQGLFFLIQFREIKLSQLLNDALLQMKGTLYEEWMMNQSDTIQLLGKAFGERITSQECLKVVLKENIQELTIVYELYCLHSIITNLSLYLIWKVFTPEQAIYVNGMYLDRIKKVAKVSMQLVDSLGLDPRLIKAPIANDWVGYNTYDNKGELQGVYDRSNINPKSKI